MSLPDSILSKVVPKWVQTTLFIGVWTLIGLTFSALSYASAITENRRISLSYALSMNLTRFYLWAILSLFIFRISKTFPLHSRPFAIRNLLLILVAVFLFATIHQMVFIFVGWEMDPWFRSKYDSLASFYRTALLSGLYLNVLIALLIVIAQHTLVFYRNYRAAEVQRSQLKAQLAQAELQALKMQLHPHFLFNALHSISALVLEDPPKANLMIARLGDFLRMTLEHSDQQIVPLRQELEFLRSYLDIEQVRFDDRLSVQFKIEPPAFAADVPHLILQPIVENAIRHAVATRTTLALITIEAAHVNGSICVQVNDNGPGLKKEANSGFGLNNVRARLKQLYNTDFSLEIRNNFAGGVTVTLRIPYNSKMSEGRLAD